MAMIGTKESAKFNLVEILKSHLEGVVKHHIEEELVRKELERFEKILREKIKSALESVVLEDVEKVIDHLKLRDEIRVGISIRDDGKDVG